MISVFKPSESWIESQLTQLRAASHNYASVGCIDTAPSGFSIDDYEICLGVGADVWAAARDAMCQWVFMPGRMVEFRGDKSIAIGNVVAVLFRGPGVWTFNPARITEVHDTNDSGRNEFGFVYGTLTGHVESGEERFLIRWDHESDRVTYRIKAVSRPKHPLVWLAYPYARYQQDRFRRLSANAMRDSVKQATRRH